MPIRQTQSTRRMLSLSAATHPDRILSMSEWCRLNGFSPRTGRRIRADGNGPVETRLSAQRIGITVANNAAWQKARACPPADVSPTPPIAVSVREACRLLAIRRGHVYRLLRNGELQSYADGPRQRRVTMASLYEFVARQLAANRANNAP